MIAISTFNTDCGTGVIAFSDAQSKIDVCAESYFDAH